MATSITPVIPLPTPAQLAQALAGAASPELSRVPLLRILRDIMSAGTSMLTGRIPEQSH